MEEFQPNPDSVRMIFIRHGHDTGSLNGDSKRELTENGIRQAVASAELFKTVNFDFIFSSDLLRTQQTCAEICAYQSARSQLNTGLREIRPFYLMGNPEMTEGAGKPVRNFLESVMQLKKGSLVLAVAHCHLIRYILTFKNVRSEEYRSVNDLFNMDLLPRDGCTIDMSNCGVSVIDIDHEGGMMPCLINYNEHTKKSS